MSKQRPIPSKKATASSRPDAYDKNEKMKPSGKETKTTIHWLILALIAVGITFALFAKSFSYEYVNWDDEVNLKDNPNLKVINAQSINDIFSLDKGSVIGNYNPLPILTFAIEKKWNNNEFSPRITHVVNVLLHLACVFLVFRMLLLMNIGPWGAFAGALLFGIHPMRVESVAWATERKDVLFGLFFIAALIYYIKWIKTEGQSGRNKYYALLLIMAILSLFSKVQAVTLPLAMLTLDYWFRRPLNFQRIWEKSPLWLFSLGMGLVNIYTLAANKSLDDSSVTNYNLFDRLLIGMYSFCVYLYKLVVPLPMAPMYPYPAKMPVMMYLTPILFAAFFYLLYRAWKSNKYREWVFAGAFMFLNVMFVLQVLGAGQGYLADRFTYIPYLGVFVAVAYTYDKALKSDNMRTIAIAIFGVFMLAFAVMTSKQLNVWQNSETLWTKVMELNGNGIALPYGNRGNYYRSVNRFEDSEKDYSHAIKISPDKADLRNSRGKTYFDMAMSGKYKSTQKDLTDKAIADYTHGLKIVKESTTHAELAINRGAAYASLGNYDQALVDFSTGLQIEPTNKNGYLNRSLAYFNLREYQKALGDYNEYIKYDPSDANIYYEMGMCHRMLEQYREGLERLNKAISMNPNLPLAYAERARCRIKLGDKVQAQADAAQAEKMGLVLDEYTKNLLK